MKNLERGFINPVLVAVLFVVLVFAGIYYFHIDKDAASLFTNFFSVDTTKN